MMKNKFMLGVVTPKQCPLARLTKPSDGLVTRSRELSNPEVPGRGIFLITRSK